MSPRSKIDVRLPVLNAYIRQHGRAPTLAELCHLFQVRSRNTASAMAKGFVSAGALRRTATGRLVAPYARPTTPLRLLGSVAAGFPSPAEEALLDTLTLDEYLIRRPEATFLLRVEGDSMLDAGILPGDVVLVERGRAPKNGDIVIACVDGEWTMKYFHKTGQDVRLEPANQKYTTIRPQRTLSIEGVVGSVIRKLL
jgi:repressor LexA